MTDHDYENSHPRIDGVELELKAATKDVEPKVVFLGQGGTELIAGWHPCVLVDHERNTRWRNDPHRRYRARSCLPNDEEVALGTRIEDAPIPYPYNVIYSPAPRSPAQAHITVVQHLHQFADLIDKFWTPAAIRRFEAADKAIADD